MSDFYANQLAEQKLRDQEDRKRKLEEERQRLEQVQRQMEEERRLKAEQRLQYKKDVEATLQRKEEEKKFEQEMSHLAQAEAKERTVEYSRKEMEREMRYKKFFQDYDKKMQARVQAHVESVSSPETTKQKQVHDWIAKNEAEYQTKLQEKERQLNEWRKKVVSSTPSLEPGDYLRGSSQSDRLQGAGEGPLQEELYLSCTGEPEDGGSVSSVVDPGQPRLHPETPRRTSRTAAQLQRNPLFPTQTQGRNPLQVRHHDRKRTSSQLQRPLCTFPCAPE